MTKSGEHTPGPWSIELQDARPHRIIVRAGNKEILAQDMCAHASSQRTIADCLDAVGFPAIERSAIIVALKEQIANAHLMASAPALLEALEELMSWIENWSPSFCDDPEWPDTRDKARAAIASAKGEGK